MKQVSTNNRATPPALIAFCREQHQQIFATLIVYTGERGLAEELTQKAFARACREWTKVEKMDRPGAWLHRVAINLANSRLRRRRARQRAETRAEAAVVEPAATDEALETRAAVRSLPEKERAVIVLRFFAGLSVDDTAVALGIPSGTVKTRARRAMQRLEADLGRGRTANEGVFS